MEDKISCLKMTLDLKTVCLCLLVFSLYCFTISSVLFWRNCLQTQRVLKNLFIRHTSGKKLSTTKIKPYQLNPNKVKYVTFLIFLRYPTDGGTVHSMCEEFWPFLPLPPNYPLGYTQLWPLWHIHDALWTQLWGHL